MWGFKVTSQKYKTRCNTYVEKYVGRSSRGGELSVGSRSTRFLEISLLKWCICIWAIILHQSYDGKVLKRHRKGKDKSQPSKRYTKKVYNSSNFTCFGCGTQGHIKVECLNQSHKDKAPEKKYGKNKRHRKAYIAWRIIILPPALHKKKKKEEANLCMMVLIVTLNHTAFCVMSNHDFIKIEILIESVTDSVTESVTDFCDQICDRFCDRFCDRCCDRFCD